MQEFVNPLAELGEQGHQADDRDRHEGVQESRRSRRRGGRLPARLRPPGVRLFLGAHGQGRAREGSRRRRSVLRRQAGDRALLFRQAAARDGGPDPHRARRRCADDGRWTRRCSDRTDRARDDRARPRSIARRAGLLGAGAAWSRSPRRTPAGLWKTSTTTPKKEKSLVRIVETNGVFSGKVEKILDPATLPDAVCKDCSDERKDKPILGMTIIRNVKASAERQGRVRGRRHPRSRTTARSTASS